MNVSGLSDFLAQAQQQQAAAAQPAATQPGVSNVAGGINQQKAQAAYAAASDWDRFVNDYQPLISKQLGSLNSNEMVEQAAEDAKVVPGQINAGVNRAMMRRGGVTASQWKTLASARETNNATTVAGIMNNARLSQRERNTKAALDLSSLGTNIYQMGLDNVRESEGLAAARRSNNAAAKQQYKSNLMSGAATLASAAIFAGI